MTSWQTAPAAKPTEAGSSSPSFMALFTEHHSNSTNIFADSARPSALTVDFSMFPSSASTASLSPSAPLPDPSAPSDDPFDLLSAVAGPLPLLDGVQGGGGAPAASGAPSSARHQRSLTSFLSTSTSSPILLSSLFPSSSLPSSTDRVCTPPPRPRSPDLSGSIGSPLSAVTSFDFFSGPPSHDLSPLMHTTTSPYFDDAVAAPALGANGHPAESDSVSFFSPIFWAGHGGSGSAEGGGRHHRTISNNFSSVSASSARGFASQPSSPYARTRSNSNSSLNPFVFTPTTTSLPHPESISPFAGPLASNGIVSPLSSTTSASASAETSAALPVPSSSDADRLPRLRAKVAAEILTSETNYVESLATLLGCFLQPLQLSVESDDRPLLSAEQLSVLSSNLHQIAQLNARFLSDIQERVEAWSEETCLGSLFLEFAHFFKMYTHYVGNHDQAVMVLQQLEGNARWRDFLAEAMKKPRVRQLPLSSFLIMPIQRVPRYKLLLQELLKHTSPTHPDYASLQQALVLVSAVAAHINDSVRANENRAKVREIQSMFIGANFVSPSRRFIRSGNLIKQCRNGVKTYLFVLFNDLLVYASKVVVTARYKVHKEIDIDSVFRVVDIADSADGCEDSSGSRGSPSSISHTDESKERVTTPEPLPPAAPSSAASNAPPSAAATTATAASPSPSATAGASGRMYKFKVLNSAKSFIVTTPDLALKQAWLTDLRAVIVERSKTIQTPSTSTASSSHAPMFVGDNASSVCQRCDKRFSLTVRKHHCNGCGRLCCSECLSSKMMVRGAGEAQRVCWKCASREEARLKKAKEEQEKLADKERERQKDVKERAKEQVEQKDILGLLT